MPGAWKATRTIDANGLVKKKRGGMHGSGEYAILAFAYILARRMQRTHASYGQC